MTAPDHSYTATYNTTYSYQTFGPAGNPSGSGNNLYLGVTRSLIDFFNVDSVSTPGWGNSNRWGTSWRLPINSYAKDVVYVKDPGFQVFQQTGRTVSTGAYTNYQYLTNVKFLGFDVQRVNWPGSEAEDPYQKVLQNLADKINNDRADLGVAAAEIGRTASMVAQSTMKLVRALRALKSCRFGDFLSTLGVTASRRKVDTYYANMRKHYGKKGEGFRWDKKSRVPRQQQEEQFMNFTARTWLEYTYGWRPLIQDVYDVAKVSAELCAESAWLWRTVRGRSMNLKVSGRTFVSGQMLVSNNARSDMRRKIVLEYQLPSGGYSTAAAFGLTNPWQIAWEVVPFSFVVDWFYPIGDFLESISTYDGLVFRRGSSMLRHVYTNTVAIRPGPPYTTGGVTYTCTSADLKAQSLEIGIRRALLTSFPGPRYPRCKDPRSISHALSAIALLQQAFLSRRP